MTDYKSTITLPQTDFPMKADLARREPAAVRRWEERGTYAKLRDEEHFPTLESLVEQIHRDAAQARRILKA